MYASGGLIIGGEFSWSVWEPDREKLRKGMTLAETDYVKVQEGKDHNLIPNAALTNALSVLYGSGTQITSWFMGIIDNSGFVGFAAGDTSSSHAGWTESSAYSESVRQTATFGAAAGNAIATSAPCSFTMTGTVSVKGAFLSSSATKAGTGGLLGVAAALNNIQAMSAGQVLKIDYNCSSASS